MPRRIVHRDEFEADLVEQVAWLRRQRAWGWIEGLQRDVNEASAMLALFPRAGQEIGRHGTETLRRLPLRTAPFLIWYAYDEAMNEGPVRLIRLFHVRQRKHKPSEW